MGNKETGKLQPNDFSVIYMVAGVSSRYQGKIKQFAKVGPQGETLIEYSLKQALPVGFTKIIFVVGNKTEQPFREFFGDFYRGVSVHYTSQQYNQKQRSKPWGTADALCTIIDIVDSPFIVCNGDDIYGEESFKILAEHLKNNNENATVGYRLTEVLPEQGTVHRGIFEVNNNYVVGIRENLNISRLNLESRLLKPDDLCNMNLFALLPETLYKLYSLVHSFKEKNKRSKTVECFLPIEISNLIKTKQITMRIYPTPSKWFGVTNPEDEINVNRELKKLEINQSRL